MANDLFQAFVAIEFDVEKAYSYDPVGGETKWGVAKNEHPEITEAQWAGWTRDDSTALIREKYWDAHRLGEMPWAWALCLGDGEVNQGDCVRLAQRALGVAVDGKVGDQTVAAVKEATPDHIDAFMAMRAHSYIADNLFNDDWKGWYARLFHVRSLAEHAP